MAPHDRPAAADVFGRVRGSRVQRARVRRARSRARSAPTRTRSSSTTATSSARCRASSGTRTSRSPTPRACRCISSSALARRHVTVVLTGEGSDELLAGYGKYPRSRWNWRAGTVYERVVPDAGARGGRRRRSCRGCPAPLGPLCAAVVPGHGRARRRRCSSTTSRRSGWRDQRALLAPALRATAPPAHAPTARRWRYFDRPAARQHAARPPALRRHEDVPRRAADEAGPDEHGGVDREPRAVPRSRARGVRRRAARPLEAVGLDDQARFCAKR